MIGHESHLRGGDSNDNAPAGQMLKGLVVAFHRGHPVVTKCNGGYPITLGRRVHLAGQTCVGEVTNKHVVRPTFGELGQLLFKFLSHKSQG